MIKIELIYDSGCPNVDAARANLKQAVGNLPFDNDWTEWERTQASTPDYIQRYGSPTVLIDESPIGKEDIDEAGNSCSIYLDEYGKVSRVPSVNQIQTAIQEATLKRKTRPVTGIISSSVSGILALIPVISCPLCWPAYSALLSALGIGFFNYSPYLIPLLISLIGVVSFLMWRDYRFHNRILPFLLALVGGTLVIIGKIIYPNDPLMYTGIASLIVASVVNIFLIKKKLIRTYCNRVEVAAKKRRKKMNKIEIFSAGCPLCEEAVEYVNKEVCESCEVIVHDLHDPSIAEHAKKYGVKRAPSVVINGQLSPCCKCEDIKINI